MSPGQGHNQRSNQRYQLNHIECDLGQVMDVSLGGMRILASRQIAAQQTATLSAAGPTEPLVVRVEVIWHRRLGRKEHLMGLRFVNMDGTARKQLAQLVRAKPAAQPSDQTSGTLGPKAAVAVIAASVILGLGGVAWQQHETWAPKFFPGIAEWLAGSPGWMPILCIAGGVLLAITGVSELRRGKSTERRTPVNKTRRGERAGGRRSEDLIGEIDQLRESQFMLNGILESSLGGVVVLRAIRDGSRAVIDLEIQLANPAAEHLLGKSESLLVGHKVSEAMPCLLNEEMYREVMSVVESGLPLQNHYKIEKSGKWMQLAVVQLRDGVVVTFADTTEHHRIQDKLRHVAFHDELTGLPNRKLLLEHVESAFNRARRRTDTCMAVLFLDFDRFKFVNDTLGHEVGDLLLINIGKRLRSNLREADQAAHAGSEHLSARLGGDEFVVMLDGIRGEEDAVAVARRLIDAFNQPHELDGNTVLSTASIGVALSRPEYQTIDELMRDADAAMYQAKNSGKARYVVFDQDMHNKLKIDQQREDDLQQSVKDEAFTLLYEPIVSLEDGTTAGFEALLRWEHPRQGTVMPESFIPLAEELNLMQPIGDWVLREACTQLAAWNKQGMRDVFITVNLSKSQLNDPDLPGSLKKLVKRHKVAASQLRLEINEKMAISNMAATVSNLQELRTSGFHVTLDQFGTGHSSLNVLHDLPLDTLKIDKSFIENAGHAAQRYGVIIATIAELARGLGMQVVATGIEREEQVDLLRNIQCDYAQGWLFSKPMSADDAGKLLLEGKAFTLAA